MTLHDWSLMELAVMVLAALVLFASFVLLAQARLVAAVRILAWQGVLVAVTIALVAAAGGEWYLYILAAMTLGLKALFIPWLLHRFIRELALERHVEGWTHPALVLMVGAALVVFSYWVSLPIERLGLAATRNIVAISLAIVLLGLLMMVARRTAVAQVIGFMSMGNGLFLAAVTTAHGMPMLVELGVAFDVLVAAILFGVFFLQIQESIDSPDVDNLNRLTEREDDQ